MPLTAMAQKIGTMLCNQRCKTRIYVNEGVIYEAMNDQVHNCPMAQRAKEFEGYYNMIRIDMVKKHLIDVEFALNGLRAAIAWQEAQNKPLAEAFIKRKHRGRFRNVKPKPEIKVASELLTK